MEEDNIKYGDEAAPEEVNDINQSTIRHLETESKAGDAHFSDKNKAGGGGGEVTSPESKERESPFKNNAFLNTLKAQKARPPSQQTSLQGWRPSTGPGNPAMYNNGYFTGDKKDWADAPKMRYPPGSVKVLPRG